MNKLGIGCHIRATKGKHNRASLILDFGNACRCGSLGYGVTVREDLEGLHVGTFLGCIHRRLEEDDDPIIPDVSVLVGSNFEDIQLKMSNCHDSVDIKGGGPHQRQISVYGRDGNDDITITNVNPISIDNSLEPIEGAGAPFRVVVDGGKGVDTLNQINDLSSIPYIVPTSLTSSSITFTKVKTGKDKVQLPHLDYFNIEQLNIQSFCNVSSAISFPELPEFVVLSTPPYQSQISMTNILLEDCTQLPSANLQLNGITIEGTNGDLHVSLSGVAETNRIASLKGIGVGTVLFTAVDAEGFRVVVQEDETDPLVVTISKSVQCENNEEGQISCT
jgi:hypothetical protein